MWSADGRLGRVGGELNCLLGGQRSYICEQHKPLDGIEGKDFFARTSELRKEERTEEVEKGGRRPGQKGNNKMRTRR